MPRNITVEDSATNSEMLKLENGDLLMIYNKVFFISTYGSQSDVDGTNFTKTIREYCSIINLQDGGRVFKDPVNRKIGLDALLKKFYYMREKPVEKKDFKHIGKNSYDLNIKML